MKDRTYIKSFIYYVLQGTQMILSIFTNFYMVRKMTVEDYGYVSLAISIVTTVAVFVYQWSGSTILYIRSELDVDNLNEVIWSRNIILSIVLIPTVTMAFIFRNRIDKYVSGPLTGWMLLLLIAMMMADYYTNYLLARKKQIASSIMGITVRIVLLLLSVFFLKDIKSFMLINIISNLVFILFLGYANKEDFFPPKINIKVFKMTMSFSLWQAVGIISLSGAQSIASIVINSVATIEEVSYYNVAFKIISAIISFESYVPLFFAPILVEYYKREEYIKIKKYFYNTRPMLLGLAIICHIIVFIASDWFIPTLFGKEYCKAIMSFKVLTIYSFFYFTSIFYSQYANTTYKYKVIQIINVISAIGTILAAVILTPLYGAVGYALANSIGLIIKLLILAFFIEPHIAKDSCLRRKINDY